MDVAETKKVLRAEALERRAELLKSVPDASRHMAENFLAHIPMSGGTTVSAYVAIGEEADPAPLIRALRARGHAIALPRVVKKGAPLAFHLYAKDAPLMPGPFGLSEPAPDWPRTVPGVLVVPLLAFDGQGNRLGYGAGFYDRTLRELRVRGIVLAVGYALSGQEVANVPHHAGDERLDWIVTERGARKFEES